MTMLEYKGYTAECKIDLAAGVIVGRVIGMQDGIVFEAESVPKLTGAFHEAVDDYLDACAERGAEPEKPFSGRFLFRTTPESHRRYALAAAGEGKSLNAWLDSVAALALSQTSSSRVSLPLGRAHLSTTQSALVHADALRRFFLAERQDAESSKTIWVLTGSSEPPKVASPLRNTHTDTIYIQGIPLYRAPTARIEAGVK